MTSQHTSLVLQADPSTKTIKLEAHGGLAVSAAVALLLLVVLLWGHRIPIVKRIHPRRKRSGK